MEADIDTSSIVHSQQFERVGLFYSYYTLTLILTFGPSSIQQNITITFLIIMDSLDNLIPTLIIYKVSQIYDDKFLNS